MHGQKHGGQPVPSPRKSLRLEGKKWCSERENIKVIVLKDIYHILSLNAQVVFSAFIRAVC